MELKWLVCRRGSTRDDVDQDSSQTGKKFMVDMSPEAVTQRSRFMGQICELSAKLMNPEVKSASDSQDGKGIAGETELFVGMEVVIESHSTFNSFAVVFEDDGETGYLYALDLEQNSLILDGMQIYNVENVSDKSRPSVVRFQWSADGLRAAFLINAFVHAVFDFEAERGYCRTGFPPLTHWSKDGHEWSDEALRFFK